MLPHNRQVQQQTPERRRIDQASIAHGLVLVMVRSSGGRAMPLPRTFTD